MDKNPYVEDNRDSNIFTADYTRKTLVAPEGCKVFGVKGDTYGRQFLCKLLNYPDATLQFTNETAIAYLQFENAVGETGSVKLKIEETTNRNDANKEGDTSVLLSANVPNSLTKEAGPVRLQLCGSYQAANGTWIHWHLAPVEVEIADFFDNEDIAVSDPKYNLVEQAHAEINALNTKVADLQKALHTSLEDIKSALDDLDESNLPDSVLTQVTANRASIQALQQKITILENAGVDIDSLSETFATLEAVADEYETKVHASETYMRKDDSDYANVVNRVKKLENTSLDKDEAESEYVKKTDTGAFAKAWRSLGDGFINVNLDTCQSNCAKFGFNVDHVAVMTGDTNRQCADELPDATMFTFAGNTACAFTLKFLGGSYGMSEIDNDITFEAAGSTAVTIERIPAGSITGKVTIDTATGSKSAFLTGDLSNVTEIQVIGAAHAGVCGLVTLVAR